jgi:hypothetical protein
MKSEHERLLNELWTDDLNDRQALLSAGRVILRRKRRKRVIRRVFGASLALAVLVSIVWGLEQMPRVSKVASSAAPRMQLSMASQVQPKPVKYLAITNCWR